ncbi:MAG: glycoside hydrolase family 127 protein [Anaerolineaceae bacterium]|nr:glycoside hydrolase family 127 protein [Anaerolineaceae bacterium]
MSEQSPRYQFHPPALKDVQFTGGFWKYWQTINTDVSIPAIYHQLEMTGRIEGVKQLWKDGDPNPPHIFWDSDIAKWIEAAAYSLAHHPDKALETVVDAIVDEYEKVQESDGYINSYFQHFEPENRWTNVRDRHELYCAGHMIEAAVAYHQATGKRKFLDIMMSFADYIDLVFGPDEGQKHGYPGHEEIELALVKLSEHTGDEKYQKLSAYFINQRGTQPHYYTAEALARGDDPDNWNWVTLENEVSKVDYRYNQSHLPVREQSVAVGHSVRAVYLYSGMADIAASTNDEALLQALERLFESILQHRSYVTGGLGSDPENEGFSDDYDLPNENAYAETCAAIGLIFWLQRMTNFDCERKYMDLLERTLYNGMLVGLSFDGTKFFYSSPLAVHRGETGEYSNFHGHRTDWHGCSCCPPNVARLLASLGQYFSSASENEIILHSYADSETLYRLEQGNITLIQETRYPWDGRVEVTVGTETPLLFKLRLRLPDWCDTFYLSVNGETIQPEMVKGYLVIDRRWQQGDVVSLSLEMQPRRIHAHPAIRPNRNRVVLAYGPLLYCLEGVDNGSDLDNFYLPEDAEIAVRFDDGLLGGINILEGSGYRETISDALPLYQDKAYPKTEMPFKAIPFAYWDNRGEGDMQLWLREI